MIARATRILLVDANEARARRLSTRLREDSPRPTLVTHVRDPRDAEARPGTHGGRPLTVADARVAPGEHPADGAPAPLDAPTPYDVVLLGLDGADPQPWLASLGERLPGVPVVTIDGDLDREALHALAALGVQGHVPPACSTCTLQPRITATLSWAVERHQLLAALDRARAEGVRVALHDGLTGLPNRRLYESRLRQLVAQAERGRRRLAVVFVDLDRFKAVNDTLGHAAGDLLLVEVARRLTAAVRANDVVARRGGDEFTLVLDDLRHEQDAARVAEKILTALREPVRLGSHVVRPGGSLGISVFPGDARDAATLEGCADAAMYGAKEDGGDRFAFYRPEMLADARARLALEADLRACLERAARGRHAHDGPSTALAGPGDLQLLWQPRRDLADGRPVGLEALLRWRRADGELLAPAGFLAVARDAGLSAELDAAALGLACAQLAAWRAHGREPPPAAVNLDPASWADASLPERVFALLRQHELPGELLLLELRESDVARDPDAVGRLAEALARGVAGTRPGTERTTARALGEGAPGRPLPAGPRLRLDGFGAGGLALAELSRLPLAGATLAPALLDDPRALAAAAALAEAVGLPPLAGGLEHDGHLQAAREARVPHGQGYRLGRPAPASEAGRAPSPV